MWKGFEQQVPFYVATEQAQDNTLSRNLTEIVLDFKHLPQILNSWFLASRINVNKKVQLDATVCRHLFTAKSIYMFRASQHPSSVALKTVTATSGIGHNTGTATSFQRGLICCSVVICVVLCIVCV